jgi:hypothetical protein
LGTCIKEYKSILPTQIWKWCDRYGVKYPWEITCHGSAGWCDTVIKVPAILS